MSLNSPLIPNPPTKAMLKQRAKTKLKRPVFRIRPSLVSRAAKMLKSLEWCCTNDAGYQTCPKCEGWRGSQTGYHTPRCPLAKLLKELL